MGSDLYIGKVESDHLVHPTIAEQARDYTSGEYLEYLYEVSAGLDLEQEPTPDEFVALMREALTPEMTQRILQSNGYFFRGPALAQLDVEHPKGLDAALVDRGLRYALVARNLLAPLVPELQPVAIRRIRITLATMHPDAGFPEPKGNFRWPVRAFALRTLGEAHVDGFFQDPFSEYFLQFGTEGMASADFCGREDDVESFVWDARYVSRTPMRVDEPAFWDAHASAWWAPRLREYLDTPSDNHPYEIATLEIDTHPTWPGTLSNEVFASRAY